MMSALHKIKADLQEWPIFYGKVHLGCFIVLLFKLACMNTYTLPILNATPFLCCCLQSPDPVVWTPRKQNLRWDLS